MYRFIYYQAPEDEVPRLDLVSEIAVTEAEGRAHLGTELGLHKLTGWSVRLCGCGNGFIATKNGVRRSVHIAPESELLADGLLATTSKPQLEVVA